MKYPKRSTIFGRRGCPILSAVGFSSLAELWFILAQNRAKPRPCTYVQMFIDVDIYTLRMFVDFYIYNMCWFIVYGLWSQHIFHWGGPGVTPMTRLPGQWWTLMAPRGKTSSWPNRRIGVRRSVGFFCWAHLGTQQRNRRHWIIIW